MKPDLRVLDGEAGGPNAGTGLPTRILRLVKSAPERRAIAAGQIDAVIDHATGTAFLLPDARQALREDQARVRSLLALSADWSWEQDKHHRFVSHTGATSGSSGIYDENIIGKTLGDPPFDMGEADWEAHLRLLGWRATFRDLELRCTDRAGGVRWVSISGEAIFDEQDQFKGYHGTMRDITLRKQSDALAQVTIENVSERARGVVSRKNVAQRKRQDRPPGPGHKVGMGYPIANTLLAALPRKDYRRLLAGLEPVTLTYGEVLYEPGDRIRHVYFPSDCLVCLLATVGSHETLEVGLVGREGMVGISLAMGSDVASVRALVQGTGTAMRMEAARFREELRQCEPWQLALYRYFRTKLALARQIAACNCFHPVESRLARWLLTARDRMQSDQLHLTQELLGSMLGVLRAAVTKAAGGLQRRNLIRYRRGHIRILDGNRLEAAACPCYAVIKDMHDGA